MLHFVSQLNRELYNVMKKLETQHSGKAFIVKGLNRYVFARLLVNGLSVQ